jgi:hypothetical protein
VTVHERQKHDTETVRRVSDVVQGQEPRRSGWGGGTFSKYRVGRDYVRHTITRNTRLPQATTAMATAAAAAAAAATDPHAKAHEHEHDHKSGNGASAAAAAGAAAGVGGGETFEVISHSGEFALRNALKTRTAESRHALHLKQQQQIAADERRAARSAQRKAQRQRQQHGGTQSAPTAAERVAAAAAAEATKPKARSAWDRPRTSAEACPDCGAERAPNALVASARQPHRAVPLQTRVPDTVTVTVDRPFAAGQYPLFREYGTDRSGVCPCCMHAQGRTWMLKGMGKKAKTKTKGMAKVKRNNERHDGIRK